MNFMTSLIDKFLHQPKYWIITLVLLVVGALSIQTYRDVFLDLGVDKGKELQKSKETVYSEWKKQIQEQNVLQRTYQMSIRADKLHFSQKNLIEYIFRTYKAVKREEAQSIVKQAYLTGQRLNLDPRMILAIAAMESSFNPNAISTTGDHGLMQVQIRLHKEKFEPFGGIEKAYDIVAGIEVGSQIFKDCLRKKGTPQDALKCYVGAGYHGNDRGYASKVLNLKMSLQYASEGNYRRANQVMRRGSSYIQEEKVAFSNVFFSQKLI